MFDGTKIMLIRQSRTHISRQKLAELTNIPLDTLRDWEKGRHEPVYMDYLNSIAKVLGCTLDDFLCDGVQISKPDNTQYSHWDSYSVTERIELAKKALRRLPADKRIDTPEEAEIRRLCQYIFDNSDNIN